MSDSWRCTSISSCLSHSTYARRFLSVWEGYQTRKKSCEALSIWRLEACHSHLGASITIDNINLWYNTYTSEERARIEKYAADNGATKATTHFSKHHSNSIRVLAVATLEVFQTQFSSGKNEGLKHSFLPQTSPFSISVTKNFTCSSACARCSPRITS